MAKNFVNDELNKWGINEKPTIIINDKVMRKTINDFIQYQEDMELMFGVKE